MTSENKRRCLQSWKAIANYFGRSERTVRRWEALEGMPVHRHQHRGGARIFAQIAELDSWLALRSQNASASPHAGAKAPVIAILPFDFFSQNEAQSFVPHALCEDIVSDLSRLPSLTVISYASTRRLPDSTPERTQSLTALQSDYYVEGSIRLAGNNVKLNVRLISAGRQTIAWSGRYDDAPADWPQLRKQVVAALINNLPLASEVPQVPAQQALIENHTAWEYVHQARFESLKWQPETIHRAIELLNVAGHLVAHNELILASLGRVYLQLRESGLDCSEKLLSKAHSILTGLQPDAYYTLTLKGWFYYLQGELANAIEALREAQSRYPNDADTLALLSNCYLVSGQPYLALPLIQQLQIIDPLTPLSRCMPGYYRLMTGDFKGAVAPYREMLEMEPANPLTRLFLVWVLAHNDDRQEIRLVCEGFLPSQRTTLSARLAFAFYDASSGDRCDFTLSESEAAIASENALLARFTAFAFAANGEKEVATKWLTRAFELGFWPYPYMSQYDVFFAPFRDYPPLMSLMREMENRWRAMAPRIRA